MRWLRYCSKLCTVYTICVLVYTFVYYLYNSWLHCQLKSKIPPFPEQGGDKLHQHIEAYWLEITIKSRRWAGQPILWDRNRRGMVRGWRGRRGHNNWIILLRWDSVTENLYYLAGINGLPFNGLRSLSHRSLLFC